MSYESEMQAALIADGEKLRALTGEDHGPWEAEDPGEWDGVFLHFIPEAPAEVEELREQLATMRAALQSYQDIAPKVMTALMATRGRDDLLLANEVHQLTYPARAALSS